MAFRKLVGDMELMPKGYGVAYLDPSRMAAVCYPIPVNIIVHYWYRTVLACRFFGNNDQLHRLLMASYEQGYEAGRIAHMIERGEI